MAAMTKNRKYWQNISSETTGPIWFKLWGSSPWMVPFQYNSKRGPSKDHLCQVWSKLANGFRGGLKEGDLRTI
jgi:hypothetical protein